MQTTLSPLSLNPTPNKPVSWLPYHTIRLLKWMLIVNLVMVVIVLWAIIAFNGYVAWILGRPAIEPLTSNPLKAAGLVFENVQFNSLDGRSVLSGWYIPATSESKKTVIFSHGYMENREALGVPIYKLSKVLHENKFNVLLFDYGYVSAGQHRPMTAGALESKELLGAIDYIKHKGAEKIFVWGFSMGAGTALQAALHNTDITGMILDSTFLLDPQTLRHTLEQQKTNFPLSPSTRLVEFFLPLLNGVGLNQIPYEEVKTTQYSMPLFLIHGGKDPRAPYEIPEQIFSNQKLNEKSQFWLATKRGHETIFRREPKEYLKRSLGFLKGL